ncbi:hypothetical protein LZ31DRAFT_559972 [Colletotrichum somersetense]|nr:hypothetical protein LZ31DRAFT_559972 [Colletotrichum somersetense]
MLRTLKDIAVALVRPTLDALFSGRHLPWSLCWRLLALQPVVFLTNSLVLAPYLFRRPYTVIYIPVGSNRSLRALLFKGAGAGTGRNGLRPLHVDCHAGGFVGGIPEASAPFCSLVAAETGAIAVSLSYRLAPVHPFPAAVRAAVTFYAPIDLRLRPEDKLRPANFPKRDAMTSMQPLYDSYAAPPKAKDLDIPRMSPFLASEEAVPERMLLVVAGIDILVQ